MKYLLILLLLTAFLFSQDYDPIDANTVAYWQQSTGLTLSGVDVTSWVDAANDKTVVQATAANSPHYENTRITGDGTNDFLKMAATDATLNPGTGSFTIEYKVAYSSSEDGTLMAQKRGGIATVAYAGWGMRTRNNNVIACLISDGTTQVASTAASLTNGTAYHIATIIDQVQDSIFTYVDNVKVDADDISSISGGITADANNLYAFQIHRDSGGRYVKDSIYYIRISDKARTEAELTNFYNYPDGNTADEDTGFKRFKKFKGF